MKIEGRTFAISGGASGLGRACAVDLARRGGSVAILDVNEENGKALEAELNKASGGGGVARFFETDVLSDASVAAAAAGVAEWTQQTGKPLGGIVAAAGVGNPAMILDRNNKPPPMSHFDFVIGINLRGTLLLITQLVPLLAAAPASPPDGERGLVVLVASVAAFDGQRGQTAYAASKGAVASMALPLARDLGRHGVRVVAVAPGVFETNMTALMADKTRKALAGAREFPQREGRPEEFAALVRHALENTMLNGTVVRLDGAVRLPSKL